MEEEGRELVKPGRYIWIDPDCGLEAVLFIDSLALGPAVGGVRTMAYDSLNDAIVDAGMLARAMTNKCSIAGLEAGGCKLVVRVGPRFQRRRAFERLGQLLAELGAPVHTGADFGTTEADLDAISAHFPCVHRPDPDLVAAAGRAVLRCVEACAERRNRPAESLHVAVQGAGVMGGAVARALAAAGMRVSIGDTDAGRAEALAAELAGTAIAAESLLDIECDVMSPCAVGGIIDETTARRVRAWAVCGAANNILRSRSAERELVGRDVMSVPDMISSAGAVTHGIARDLMKVDPTVLVDRLGQVAAEVLDEAQGSGRTPEQVALDRAQARIDAAS